MKNEAVIIQSYAPDYFKEIREPAYIYEQENRELTSLWDEVERGLNNMFIETSDEYGVNRLESVLQIDANRREETLEFRKERLKNRINLKPPFTLPFLRSQLDNTIGVGQYKVYADYPNYTLYLESSAVNQAWFEEISFTVNKVKPANIVFINKPLVADGVLVSEEIHSAVMNYNYRLGAWSLGQKPIVNLIGDKVIKRSDAMSVQAELLVQLAADAVSKVDRVLINETLVISEFTLKQADESAAVVEYTVKAETLKGSPIINVKLVDIDGAVLFNAPVYVPVDADTLVKHTIRIREGV